jgi:peptidase M28-like protein
MLVGPYCMKTHAFGSLRLAGHNFESVEGLIGGESKLHKSLYTKAPTEASEAPENEKRKNFGVSFAKGAGVFEFYREGYDDGLDPDFTEPALQSELEKHVYCLAGEIGERNFENYDALEQAVRYIENYWSSAGYAVEHQHYRAEGRQFTNLWTEIPGRKRPEEIVVLGAHYDTIIGTPGADDNASAVAGLLALSGRARGKEWDRTLRFVAFANEEPPFFMSSDMGSLVYAQYCEENDHQILAMVCLEMLGFYSESQPDTLGLLPAEGNFIALVGDPSSEDVVKKAARAFREKVKFPFQAAAPPEIAVPYVGFSDHWSFWQCGYPAFMVTDTGPLRNPHYHRSSDLPHTLNYDLMTRVVFGVEGVLEKLTSEGSL